MTNPSRAQVEALIRALAAAEGLPASASIRQCEAESGFRQFAATGKVLTSPCGALGLFQLMPDTAKELGVDPLRWHENVQGGMKYMGRLLRSFDDYPKAVAAYNCGPGRLRSIISAHGQDWRNHLPEETKGYLAKICPVSRAAGAGY